MPLLFNMLSRIVIAFLPRRKHLISWQSPSAVILEPKKRKSVIASTFSPSVFHEVMGLDAWTSFFECWVLSQLFHFPLSPSSRGFLAPLYFLPLEWYHLHIWGCWYFSQQSWFQFVSHPAKTFCMKYSAWKLNKQGDDIQSCPTPFLVLNHSVVPWLVLSVASWHAYRFLRR